MQKKTIVKPIRTTTVEPKLLGLRTISLDKIQESENPIRSKYTKIVELAKSLKVYGLIHPPLVMPVSNPKYDYEIVAGNRRLRALRKAGKGNATFMVLQEGISDFDALFYTGIENIQIENVSNLDRGKWALALSKMDDPVTGQKPKFKDIAERAGVEVSTLNQWVRAARTALNIEEAAEEITAEAKTFLAKIQLNHKETHKQYLASLPEKLGVVKLQELRKVAESSEELAKHAAIVDYKGLSQEETKRFVKILREEPARDPLQVATEIKGATLVLQLPHEVRNALVKYATTQHIFTDKAAVSILRKVLKQEGYL